MDWVSIVTSKSAGEAQARFQEGIPLRPYCSDDPRRFGVRIRRREQALRYPYVQPNPPWRERYLNFDADYVGAAFAADDVGLPAPTYTVVNPRTAHAHLVYELERPIFPGYSAKADSYLAAVKGGMLNMLRADPDYRGLLIQNPLNPRWNVLTADVTYTLDQIAEQIPRELLRPVLRRQEHQLEINVGRNCDLFDKVRWRAYAEVRNCAAASQLYETALNLCLELNTYNPPLPDSELRSIARSITKWTWRHRDRIRKWRNRGVMRLGMIPGLDLSERQRRGAAYTAMTRADATSAKIEAAMAFFGLDSHPTVTQIAKTAGINRRTAYRHGLRRPTGRYLLKNT